MSEITEKIPLLVICGPTASGKTRLAVDLALEYNGEVISADSMQVYRDLSVITARVTEEEMRGVPHHLVGFLPLEQGFSVAEYVEFARKKIAEVHARGKLPIVCGGTGLYISSLVNNVCFDDNGADSELRECLERFAKINGRLALWERLNAVDPEAAAAIHENNVVRVVRALEVYERTGVKFSEQKRLSVQQKSPYNACVIEIAFHDRAVLYERINRRVDIMLKDGIVEEAKRVFETGNPLTASQAIGYKELVPYLSGEQQLEPCIEKIKTESRRYAKRQLTWFRRMQDNLRVYFDEAVDYKIFFKNVQNTIAKSQIL